MSHFRDISIARVQYPLSLEHWGHISRIDYHLPPHPYPLPMDGARGPYSGLPDLSINFPFVEGAMQSVLRDKIIARISHELL